MVASSPSSTNKPQDQLLLALAHGPLSAKLLANLVERIAESSFAIAQAMRDDDEQQQTQSNRDATLTTPTQRLLLTGSSRVSRPGRELKEWETLWTAGEHVMNRVVERIGLEKFHLVGTDIKLVGHLIDISQQNMLQEEKENGHDDNNNSDWESTLKDDIIMAATRAQNHLRIRRAAPVAKATVVVPIGKVFARVEREMLVNLVESALCQTWDKADGPLQRVEVAVELVD